MKYFHFDKDINTELFNSFLDFINRNEDEEKVLILNSDGGSNNYADIIISIINEKSGQFKIISAKSYSAAFRILFMAKCKKAIVENTMGCFHHSYLTNIDLDSVTKKPVYVEHDYQVKNLKCKIENLDTSFMTNKELAKFKKGKDVYFIFSRMREIFPKAEVI